MIEMIELSEDVSRYIEGYTDRFSMTKGEIVEEIIKSHLLSDPTSSIIKPWSFKAGTYPHQRARQRKKWKKNREEKIKDECERCGSTENLCIHHEGTHVNYFEIWMKTLDKWVEYEVNHSERVQRKIKKVKRNPENVVTRCPNCGNANIYERKIKEPKYRCYECRTSFEEPELDNIELKKYKKIVARTVLRKYTGNVLRDYFEKIQDEVKDYVEMNDVKTLCKSCHNKINRKRERGRE